MARPNDLTRTIRCPLCLKLKGTEINGEFPGCLNCHQRACHDCLSFGYMRSMCPRCSVEYPDPTDDF